MRVAPIALVVSLVSACFEPPPHLVLTVADPEMLAVGASALRISVAGDAPQTWALRERALPVSLTVTHATEGARILWVDAVDESGAVLARGRADAVFARDTTRAATVQLALPCDGAATAGRRCTLEDGSGPGLCIGGRCSITACGDRYVDAAAGEQCDDGNLADSDACRPDCTLNVCGDGDRDAAGEACDDGNTLDGDGCRGDCAKVEVCGDGVLDVGEGCDDGNDDANDGCMVREPIAGTPACRRSEWRVAIEVGYGVSEGDPTLYYLNGPHRVVADRAGNMIIADSWAHQIVRVDALSGTISLVAGNGFAGFSGDGGPATAAELNGPVGLAVDGLSTIFIADYANNRIRRVDPTTGVITTVAGNGAYAFADGPAAVASFAEPYDVAVDFAGNLFIADAGNVRIRRIDAETGMVTTVTGDGTVAYSGDGSLAVDAQIGYPYAVATDRLGNIYFGDLIHPVVRRVDAVTGIITTVAGTGAEGVGCPEGPAATTDLVSAWGLTFDRNERLLVTLREPSCIIRLDLTTGELTAVAGTGLPGLSGDGGQATDAQLDSPWGTGVAPDGDILIADDNNGRIRRVDVSTGTISTVVGGESARFGGDGGSARSATFEAITDVGLTPSGELLILDYIRVRRVDPATGVISTIAGGSTTANSGDGGPMSDASLWMDTMALDANGNIFLAGTGGDIVRRIDAHTGIIDRFAGTGVQGFAGDDGPAIDAELGSPMGLATDGAGNLYIADSLNWRVRRVDATTGVITTVAGDGTWAFATEGAVATETGLSDPHDVAVDDVGNLFFTDTSAAAVRCVDATTGILTTVAGTGVHSSTGDGSLAVDATLNSPAGLAIDGAGNLFVSSTISRRIRRIAATSGVITTVAGDGTSEPGADGSLAVNGGLIWPGTVFADAAGNVYFGENDYVRRIDGGTGLLETLAGPVAPVGDAAQARARFGAPAAMVTLGGSEQMLVADGLTGAVRRLDWTAAWVSTVSGFRFQDADYVGGAAAYGRRLRDAAGIAYDATTATVFLSEREGHTLRALHLVDPAQPDTWTVTPFAGMLDEAAHVDGALASARFAGPAGLALEPNDPLLGPVLYVAETGNHIVRRIALSSGEVDTLAGVPRFRGFFGDGVPATEALLSGPAAVAVGPSPTRANGSLYVADTDNNRVRRVDLDTGVIDTVIGDGVPASSGVGAPARYFPVDHPRGLITDGNGNLFITSSWTVRQVVAGDDGIATGDDEVMTLYGAPPRDLFPGSVTGCLSGLAWDPVDPTQGALLLLDACQGFLLRLERAAVDT